MVWGVCGAGWCREGIRGYGRFEWYFGIFALLERVDVVGVVVTGKQTNKQRILVNFSISKNSMALGTRPLERVPNNVS